MITKDQIFNENTLNIFTDASMTNIGEEMIGGAGYIAVIGDSIVGRDIRILRDTTISESEIYAIYMAIQFALLYKGKLLINIFSDSQFAVYSLREWIFCWMNHIKNNKLYNSSRKEVACQSIILNIIYTILSYDLRLSLYHVRGHFTKDKIDEFIQLFTKHNFLNDYIDEATANSIIYYNSKIDKESRRKLKGDIPPKLAMPQYFAGKNIDLDHYRNLLNI